MYALPRAHSALPQSGDTDASARSELVATSTDRNGNATSFVYDTYNLNIATTTNALRQSTQVLYSLRETGNQNGKVTRIALHRKYLRRSSEDWSGWRSHLRRADHLRNPTVSQSFNMNSTSTTSYIKPRRTILPPGLPDSYQYFDGLYRHIQERKVSQTSGTYVASDRTYNAAGLLASESCLTSVREPRLQQPRQHRRFIQLHI